MKKIALAAVIFLFTNFASAATGCEDLVFGGMLPKPIDAQTVLCKKGFVIGYSTDRKAPLWVAERLDPTILSNMSIKQRPPFHSDTSVPVNRQPLNSDFPNTGFDKGHMVPFEDMSFSEQSAFDSMSLTNIVPQNLVNNRGAWKSLENYARRLAKKGTIFVVSGPIYEGRVDTIGSGLPIPTSLYKVIIDPTAKTSKTFILPNRSVGKNEMQGMISTRKRVQDLTGVDPAPLAALNELK